MTSWSTTIPYKATRNMEIGTMEVDNHWRYWIAENLLLGHPLDSIIQSMINGGVDSSTAHVEVMTASKHPYLQAGVKANMSLVTKIKKRDWILDNYCRLEHASSNFGIIERKHKLPRREFLRDYYTVNRPVIIQGAMDNWAAITKWTPAYLKKHLGSRLVEIQANRHSDNLYEINMKHHQKLILFGDYIDKITSNKTTNDFYMTASNTSKNKEALKELWDDFDMLPEYLDTKGDRNGFFWFGPAGTITPLHHDLTNNFMAQVCGRKLIKLVSSCQIPYVYNHLHCYSHIDMDNIDYDRYPLFKKAQVIELILEPGEILFLPVGYWHYVRALDISITMSFTNFLFDNDFSSTYTTYNEI